MPRKTRAAQKAEQTESKGAAAAAATTATTEGGSTAAAASPSPSPVKPSPKGKAKQVEAEAEAEAKTQGATEVADAEQSGSGDADADVPTNAAASSPKVKQSMEERKERMAALRKKMVRRTERKDARDAHDLRLTRTALTHLHPRQAQSSSANRKDLLLDKQARLGNRRDGTNSRKLAKAEAVLDERDAKERGEDWERVRNWKYSIEDEERWEEMKAAKEERQDQGIIDDNTAGARSYARQLRGFKPDVEAYRQGSGSSSSNGKAANASSALVPKSGSSSTALVHGAANPNDLSYGAHRPNDDAIDRVVSHLNVESSLRDKRSRKRPQQDGGDVTYINEKNAAFNRKVNRHFDQYTQEIRDNFERGTA